jgi:hypothetical protein
VIWLAAAGAVLAAGAVVPAVSRWRAGGVDGARARARSEHARLGHALAVGAVPADDSARRRHEQATERWHTAGGLLAEARTPEECALAEQCAREGLALLR